MKYFFFKEIKFYSGDYQDIKKEFDKGGVLVAPAASALANIAEDEIYYKSLIKSNIAILDSGFFCILLRLFSFKKVKKLSGYLFLRKFLESYNNDDKILLVNPSLRSDELNIKLIESLKINNFKSYVAPFYKLNFNDSNLLSLINEFKPRYIMINIGGGKQEPLGIFIRENIDFKTSIMCTGAAIAFMTGEQAPINKTIDKLYLGWLYRIIWNPTINFKRFLKSLKIVKFFFNN